MVHTWYHQILSKKEKVKVDKPDLLKFPEKSTSFEFNENDETLNESLTAVSSKNNISKVVSEESLNNTSFPSNSSSGIYLNQQFRREDNAHKLLDLKGANFTYSSEHDSLSLTNSPIERILHNSKNKNWRRQKEKNKTFNSLKKKKKKKRNPNFLCKVKYNYGYLFDVSYLRNGTDLKFSPDESSRIAIKELQKRFPDISSSIKISKNYVCPHMKYNNTNVCFISDRQTALKEHLLTHGDCYYECPKCHLKISDKKTGLQHCINVCKVIKCDNELSQLFVLNIDPKVLDNYRAHDPHKYKALNNKELQLCLLSVKKKKGFSLPLKHDGSIDTSILDAILCTNESPKDVISKISRKLSVSHDSDSSNINENNALDSQFSTARKGYKHCNSNKEIKKIVGDPDNIPVTNKRITTDNSSINASATLFVKNNVSLGFCTNNMPQKFHITKLARIYQTTPPFLTKTSVSNTCLPSLKSLFEPKEINKEAGSDKSVFGSFESVRNLRGMELLLKATECMEYDCIHRKVLYVKYAYVAKQKLSERESI